MQILKFAFEFYLLGVFGCELGSFIVLKLFNFGITGLLIWENWLGDYMQFEHDFISVGCASVLVVYWFVGLVFTVFYWYVSCLSGFYCLFVGLGLSGMERSLYSWWVNSMKIFYNIQYGLIH